jgi:dTDP-4-amino-4,6-dideoxygalactose transaminase
VPTIEHHDHVWHLFVVRTPQRDRLREYLHRAGVETGLHYPVPLHRQPCLQFLSPERDTYPRADRWANEGLSLPLFYGMTPGQVDRISGKIRDFFLHGGA